uniref:EGF-like domain-containing protein n=1 Tax=Alexandrium monilatum TaxID=311494 RepID=A0A7S4PUN2_9DINO
MARHSAAPLLIFLGCSPGVHATPAAARGGDAVAGGVERRLDGEWGRCSTSLLKLLNLPTLERYEACISQRVKSTNMSVPGADVWVKASCWCEINPREELDQFDCCAHPNFHDLCQLQCNASCVTESAASCMATCPAMCLEEDYKFPDCSCREDNCFPQALCILERARNRTFNGELPLVCDDYYFERSEELQKYHVCMQDRPLRTNWHRYHSSSYCACKSGLKAALTRYHCCSAGWAKPICETPCLDAEQCNTTQAVECLSSCNQKCQMVTPKKVTTDCYGHCFSPTAQCSSVRTCKPREESKFDYLCTSGEPPMKNGCCRQRLIQNGAAVIREDCPLLCRSGQKYDFTHGSECQCFGCPSTTTAIRSELLGRVIREAIGSGQLLLVRIAAEVGLKRGPTGDMQELMNQRNMALKRVVDSHQGSLASLERAIEDLAADWNARILAEAENAKACEGNPRSLRCRDARLRGLEGEGSFLIFTVLFGVISLVLFASIFVYLIKQNRGALVPSTAQAANHSPQPGDANVVVGRPVDASQASAAEGVLDGSPMATGKTV